MCSAPAVRTVVRAGTAVATFGTSEIARAIPGPVGAIARTAATLPENVATATGSLFGMKNTPGYLGPFTQIDKNTGQAYQAGGTAPLPSVGDAPVETPPAPGATFVDSLTRRRKRLTSLQRGLLSTIGTSSSGATGAPLVSAPAAGGTGLKLKLGA